MKTLCYIQARAGSKRFPGKNTYEFHGKPMVQWSIDIAVASQLFDEIVITTDDDEVKQIARRNGVEMVERSAKAADDFATDDDVAQEMHDVFKHYDVCCRLYACTPLLPPRRIVEGFQRLVMDCDQAYGVAEYEHPPERALAYDTMGRLIPWMPEVINRRTQDFKRKYYDPGAFQIWKVSAYKDTLWIPNSTGVHLSYLDHHDIDYPKDVEMASLKYQFRKEKEMVWQ
jgi:N-acylneuraminate cytidylyltransferase